MKVIVTVLAFLLLGPLVVCGGLALVAVIASWVTPHPRYTPGPSPVSVTPSRPIQRTLVPTSQFHAQTWRYTTRAPGPGWQRPGFDDHAWKQGPGPFGAFGSGLYRPPTAVVRTPWRSGDIWLRRRVSLPHSALTAPRFLAFHDEDVEIFVDGQLGATALGYTVDYQTLPIRPAARVLLRPGATVTLAAHCHQTVGGQEIDVGIVE